MLIFSVSSNSILCMIKVGQSLSLSHSKFKAQELGVVRACKLAVVLLSFVFHIRRARRVKEALELVQQVGNSSRRCSWLGISPLLRGTPSHRSSSLMLRHFPLDP